MQLAQHRTHGDPGAVAGAAATAGAIRAAARAQLLLRVLQPQLERLPHFL
jgi:ADP-ribosylglycohydrolase